MIPELLPKQGAIRRPMMEGSFQAVTLEVLLQSLALRMRPFLVMTREGNASTGLVWVNNGEIIRCLTRTASGWQALFDLSKGGASGGFQVYGLPEAKIPAGSLGEIAFVLFRLALMEDEQGEKTLTDRLKRIHQ